MEDKIIVIEDAFSFHEKHKKSRYNHTSKEWLDDNNKWSFDELETIFNIKNIYKLVQEGNVMRLFYKSDVK